MIARNLDAGVRCAWVLADAAYGSDHGLRRMFEEREQAYVLAVRSNYCLRFIDDGGIVAATPSELVEEFADEDWSALAAAEGSKGPRLLPRPPISRAFVMHWSLRRRRHQAAAARAHYKRRKHAQL